MKNYLIALAVLGTAMLSSCVQEKSFDNITVGENDIAFVMQNNSTRSAEMGSGAEKGVSLKLGTTPNGEPLVFEETIEELNPGPVTRGIPIYTTNVGKVYDAMNVYGTYPSGSTYVTGGFGVNGATFEAFDMYPHPGSDSDGWRYRGSYSSSPWPDKTTPVDFYLRMPESGTGETDFQRLTDQQKVSFTLASPAKAKDQQDLLFGFTSISKQQHDGFLPAGAPVTMLHALTAVKFANGHENNSQTKTIISRVEFTGLVDNGSCVMNLATGEVNWTPGDARTDTQGNPFMFYQDYDNPDYVKALGKNNSDGTVDFTKEATNPDLYGTSWTNGTEKDDMKKSGASHNLNDADGSLTFWFIPQQVSENVKLTVYFQIKTPDTPNGIDLKPVTIDFGKLVNGVGTDNPKQIEWKAGQLRTYTLVPYEVDVEIEDQMKDTSYGEGTQKADLHIANTGNVDEYVRVLIMGNWYGWKPGTTAEQMANTEPSILVGYKYKTQAQATAAGESFDTMVDPWFRGGYKGLNPSNPNAYVDPYGEFDSSFTLANLGSRDGQPDDWAAASGGFYYTSKIGPGAVYENTTSATKNLFDTYTVTNVPHIYLPVGNGREEAVGVHLVMEIVVQAIEVPKTPDGQDIWWLEAWYEATKIDKLHPNALEDDGSYRNKKYRDLYKENKYAPAVAYQYPIN